MAKNWNEWHSRRPAWFTEDIVSKIPIDFIPGGTEEGVLGELDDIKRMSLFNSRKEHAAPIFEILGSVFGCRSERDIQQGREYIVKMNSIKDTKKRKSDFDRKRIRTETKRTSGIGENFGRLGMGKSGRKRTGILVSRKTIQGRGRGTIQGRGQGKIGVEMGVGEEGEGGGELALRVSKSHREKYENDNDDVEPNFKEGREEVKRTNREITRKSREYEKK